MDLVSFVLFVLFALVGIFALYRASEYVSRMVEEEQETTQSGLEEDGPKDCA